MRDSTNRKFKLAVATATFLLAFNFLQAKPRYTKHIMLMAYNVENLFDATDDGLLQEDVTYLPLAIKKTWRIDYCKGRSGFYYKECRNLDWTQTKYEQKLKKIATVILSQNLKKGPDVIVFEELENYNVLKDLWSKHLKRKGYKAPIHYESPSTRGIDVGIISKFKLIQSIRHPVDVTQIGDAPTRDIIEARLEVEPGQELRVTANHWPSLSSSHPGESRFIAARVLMDIAIEAKKDGVPLVAMGDFNTLDQTTPNPISDFLSDNRLDDTTRPFVDAHTFLSKYKTFPAGTHYYKGEWSHLDRILLSKNLLLGTTLFEADPYSFRIVDKEYLFKEISQKGKLPYKVPHRFNFDTAEGYSDHLPIVINLYLN